MTKFLLFSALLFLFSFNSRSQQQFDANIKAYMYHVVMKSPILFENIGRYFEYSGPVIRMGNGNINYDSMDVIIQEDPELLFIRSSEIGKCSPGIIAELANKTAIWELNLTLMENTFSGKDVSMYKNTYDKFITILSSNLPEIMLTKKNGQIGVDAVVLEVLNPSIPFNVKRDILTGSKQINVYTAQEILEAINLSIVEWVEDRTYQIFGLLGGKTEQFKNILLAAGDGSLTSGLLDEREKDSKGRFYRGLPRAIGFFPYQMQITNTETNLAQLKTIHFPDLELKTHGQGRITNLHPDVWGYNDKKQTTLVIEKSGKQYILFGSQETRFLSPDSTFAAGGTFMSVVNDLEFRLVADLREKIYGKKGFDYWIEFYTAEEKRTRQEITRIEIDLNKYRSSKNRNSKTNKKKLKILQDDFIKKENYLDVCQSKLKSIKKEKEIAFDLLNQYELKLSKYKSLIGSNWVPWEMEDGIFRFADGCTFDIKTQDFRFPPTPQSEPFEIRLLAVPFNATKDDVDEVMVHISLSDMPRDFDKKFKLQRLDWFASNSFQLNEPIFSKNDTIVIHDLMEALNQQLKIEVKALAGGVGKFVNDSLVQWEQATEESAYPGESDEQRALSAQSDAYKKLRQTQLSMDLKENISIEVSSFTDPVRTNFSPQVEQLQKWIASGKISNNDALSACRTASVLLALKSELMTYAGTFLDREKAAKTIDFLENEFKKIKITIGDQTIALSAFGM